MSSSFADSFDQYGGDSPAAGSDHPFDDGYFESHVSDSTSIYTSGIPFASDPVDFSPEIGANGPILSPPEEMVHEEVEALVHTKVRICARLNFVKIQNTKYYLLEECLGLVKGYYRRGYGTFWFVTKYIQVDIVRVGNRQNAIRLEDKEKREKELLNQIIVEADQYKAEFHQKKEINREANISTNREKEKIFVASQEKFHADADKDYWKSIADLIPKEVPAIEKRKGKKEQEKKPSILVVQGPKSGKPTDLSRMRQLLLKLKHNTPAHLKPSPPSTPNAKADTSAAPITVSPEAVAAA
ncbi:clathrin light chain 2 [Dorcoceras hygrometricum]|uniref:Clathrin light chain 2 n=1 Tax=Dorcoceras hygrometricum TaxID=472368 RepID=A0A2Z7ARJ7_9LAMI|nr:clathrin light chain 2 [Dorcoceras hygrometricum]